MGKGFAKKEAFKRSWNILKTNSQKNFYERLLIYLKNMHTIWDILFQPAKIREFSLQIIHEPIEISANGFFTINFTVSLHESFYI